MVVVSGAGVTTVVVGAGIEVVVVVVVVSETVVVVSTETVVVGASVTAVTATASGWAVTASKMTVPEATASGSPPHAARAIAATARKMPRRMKETVLRVEFVAIHKVSTN